MPEDIEEVEAEAEAEAQNSDPNSWSQLWQLPALLAGTLFLILGVYLSLPESQDNQFPQVLDEVALYLKANNLDQAEQRLKEDLEPNISTAEPQIQARFWMLWGDLIYQQQRARGWDKRENHELVSECYAKAQELGIRLDGPHLRRLAETHVALGQEAQAFMVLEQLGDQPGQRSYGVIRKIIERRQLAGADPAELSPLIARYESHIREEPDREAKLGGLIWVAGLQAGNLLRADEPRLAIQFLQRRMIGLMAEGGDEVLTPLRILLAKAYQRLGEFHEAERWYRLAQQQILGADPLNADILVGLGQIALAEEGDVRTALELFSSTVKEYPTSEAYLTALIGQADCEAQLGAHPEALENFAQAVERLRKASGDTTSHRDMITEIIRAHYDLLVAREEYDLALDYLIHLKPLHGNHVPARLLLEFANLHDKLAKQRRADALGTVPGEYPGSELPKSAAVRLANQEAASHYEQAAGYYLLHAREVGASDDNAYADSLWRAAVSYDMAQLWDQAIAGYEEFVASRPADPRQLEAVSRLGLAYQSQGSHKAAVDLLKTLVETNPKSPEAQGSLVTLARSYLALGEYDAGERVLQHVVTDHPAITPDSKPYIEGLIELGRYYLRQGMHEQAIERLTEAVDRYGDQPDGSMLRFELAESYRQSIDAIEITMKEPMAQSRYLALQAERARRLESAQAMFADVIDELEDEVKPRRTPVETILLRNAYFYRADCAYDLGRFEEAIGLYDQAAKRWETHPASLVALVQIVNAYCELGRVQQARVANERARWHLKRIPDEAFDDPSRLPMTREHWQDWLRWSSELDLFGTQANAAPTSSDDPTP